MSTVSRITKLLRFPARFPLSRRVVAVGIGATVALMTLTTCQPSLPAVTARRAQRVPPPPPAAVVAAVPVVAPVEYQAVTKEEAEKINAAPIAEDPGPAARSFVGGAAGKTAAVDCLTSAVYYEAASESDDGERAVAQVVLNRVRHPAFPNSVCGVVYQGAERPTGCQFTFACDGALARVPSASGWQRARRIAIAALKGHVFKPVGNATHYHADWVVPYWASSLTRSATIGAHIFYRWAGDWGTPHAFYRHYAGTEPDTSALVARWTGATPAVIAAPPVIVADAHRLKLLEDRKVVASAKIKPTRLAADRESGGLVADLTAAPRLEADRARSGLKADTR